MVFKTPTPNNPEVKVKTVHPFQTKKKILQSKPINRTIIQPLLI